jgi:hypothetical protein
MVRTSIELIVMERLDHQYKHGFTVEADKRYKNGELLKAALFAIDPKSNPWPEGWEEERKEKIANKSLMRRLAIAAALISAHMDALQDPTDFDLNNSEFEILANLEVKSIIKAKTVHEAVSKFEAQHPSAGIYAVDRKAVLGRCVRSGFLIFEGDEYFVNEKREFMLASEIS